MSLARLRHRGSLCEVCLLAKVVAVRATRLLDARDERSALAEFRLDLRGLREHAKVDFLWKLV